MEFFNGQRAKRKHTSVKGVCIPTHSDDNAKTAGEQRKKSTHIPWETLDMELMRIVIEATALVLSGRLDELSDK